MISSDKRLAPLHGEPRNKPCQTLAHVAVSRYMEETAQAAKPKRCLPVPETLGNSVPQRKRDTTEKCPYTWVQPPAATAPPARTLLFKTKPQQEREQTHSKGAAAGSASLPKHSSCGDPLLKTAKQTSPPSFGFTSESLVHSWKLQKNIQDGESFTLLGVVSHEGFWSRESSDLSTVKDIHVQRPRGTQGHLVF